MAPIKFEENLKDKLEQRTINPSAKSWDALATRLEAKEDKKKKGGNMKLWFTIAASIIGVLFAYNMLFNTSDSNIPSENVVEINIEIENNNLNEEDNTSKEVIVKNQKETPILEDEPLENTSTKVLKRQTKNTYVAKVEPNRESLKTNTINNNTSSERNNGYYASKEIESNIKNEVNEPLEIIDENTVATLQTETIEVTDIELDALLKNAESTIAKTNTNNTIPLDYNELLQDVEDDLEESFRDKLLKTVKGSYHSVKTYVAERNE